MSQDKINVNKLTITIQRSKHDKENPYVMISKKMLRDKDLSPKAKGVLCYLLSLPNTWQTHPRQVADAMGVGKDQIYTILNELLRLGYAFKTLIKNEKGRFGGVLYEFYEERLPVADRFKENTTVSGNPDADNPDMETPPIIINNLNENNSIEKITPPIPPQIPEPPEAKSEAKASMADKSAEKKKKISLEFSEEVKELADKMIKALHLANPHWLIPKNLFPIQKEVDKMINEEKRDPKIIFDVFMWTVCDSFWMDKLCKPNPAKYLREQFGQLAGKMNAMPVAKERKFAPSSNDARSLEKMEEWSKDAL